MVCASMQRAPRPELAPFVARLWSHDATAATARRELVLPTGAVHVVVRLDEPLRVYDALDATASRAVGLAVVGGARSSAYVRDVSRPVRSVGAQLRVGAAGMVLGVPAVELAERHTSLDDVWGRDAVELRERLCAERDPARRLDLFEAALIARLPRVRGVHPSLARALDRLARRDDVGAVVDEVGVSHRHFIAMFRDAVGITPKTYSRVRRMQRALRMVTAGPLARAALDAGYSDQAHLAREFRALVGVTPREYARLTVGPGNHVPLDAREKTFKNAKATAR